MTEQDGNGEKRTLNRLLTIALSIIGALFGAIILLIAFMWSSLAEGQERNVAVISENRERIIKLEVINDLRSQGKLKEE